MKHSVEKLMGKVIVSCQAYDNTPLYGSDNMKLMAASALMGGAAGIRACWPQDIIAIRSLGEDFPIIGINKAMSNDADPEALRKQVFITPDFPSAKAVIDAGADIVALDCSIRETRGFDELCTLLRQIREAYPEEAIMADLIRAEDGLALADTGLVDILSTTLSAMNPDHPQSPDYDMIRTLKENTALPVNAEGGIWEVRQLKACVEAGADMVTIGTAITRPHLITRRFVEFNATLH
jgi:N-acylglucosamine-6-phosphate 2-epimerase